METTVVEQQDVEFVDEKEVIRMMNHHHPPTSNSSSSSSNATTALLSASTSSPISSGAGATPDSATTESTTVLAPTTAIGAAAAAVARQTAIQGNSSSTSTLSFFPRATASSSSTLTRNLGHHHDHHFPHQQEQIPHSLSSSEEYASAGDPSLQTYLSPSSSYENLLEVQSNATSGYTSGGGGSDLEVAARRILRGKKGCGRKNGGVCRHPPSRSGGIMSESEEDDGDDTDDDDDNGIVNLGHGYHINRKNSQNTTNNSGTGRALPLGWRERIQRKTGMQLLKLPLSQPPPPSQLPSSSSIPTPSTTDCVTAAPIETTNPVDYSYCYDDNVDSCNQLGVYRGDGELAMTKRVNNVDNADVSAASTDHDNDEMDDVIANEEWQHPRQQHQYDQHQFKQQQQYEESYPARHPPTPSPTESIETTYHLEDLENNGAFPSRSPNRYHHHGQNGGYDRGYTAQPHPSDHWQFEQHQQQEHRRLPILHEYPDHHSTQHHTTDGGYDDASYSYDAEVDEDKEDENDFDQIYYSHDNEEYNTDILIQTTTHRDHDPFTFGPILNNDKMNDNGRPSSGDSFSNKIRNINRNNPLVPIIINEYGFPPIPINPDVAHFGDNYYVKKEGVRMSNNSTFISQRSRNVASPSSQKTGKRRVHFASSVVVGEVSGVTVKGDIQGGGGEIHGVGVDGGRRGSVDNDNLDSDGFDDDEYFHRFYYNSTLTEEGLQEKHNCQQRRQCHDESTRGGVPTSGDWEEIPATPKVEWASTSPSRRDLRTSSLNELKTGVSISAWSVPESVSLKNASAGSAPAANVFASWNGNDRSHPTDNGGDGQGQSSISQPKLQKETSKEKFIVELNSVMYDITQSSSRPPRGKSSKKSRSHQQRVYAFYDQWVQESKDAQLSTRKTAEYSLSDGDLSDKGYATGQSTGGESGIGTNGQKKRGLKFFRGRNRAYNSEGERSNTSAEGGKIKGSLSFNLSPLSSGRKDNTIDKKKGGLGAKIKSPRRMRLFGHTNHHSLGNIDIENEKLSARKESEVEGGVARSLLIDVSNETRIGQSSMASASSAATEHCVKDSITKSEVDATPETDTSPRCSNEPESTTIISDSIEQEDEQPLMDLNLNDSRETYSTPIASNAKAQTRFRHPKALPISPRAATHANKYKPSGIPSSRSNILPKSGPNGNKTVANDRIASQRKPGWAQVAAPIRTECDDVQTVSTLGSLVTQDSTTFPVPRHKAPFSSDASTVTELSEIEKLRRENYLLREKLENVSQLSSKVSSNAESLKLENNCLREDFENVSQLPTIAKNQIHQRSKQHGKSLGSIHQTTLETLLEKGNNKKLKKSRRRARRDSPVADFNHLPPVAHLINGVDFDDDSITSSFTFKGFYSQIKYPSRGDGCETPEDLLKKTCSRIATTTRSVASQMKSAIAQDPNNEFGTAPSSRTLNCFTTCRRDKTNDGTTIYVTEQQFNSARGNNMRHNHNAVPSNKKESDQLVREYES